MERAGGFTGRAGVNESRKRREGQREREIDIERSRRRGCASPLEMQEACLHAAPSVPMTIHPPIHPSSFFLFFTTAVTAIPLKVEKARGWLGCLISVRLVGKN